MARPLRIEYAGAFYHIISRGNEKGKIFASDFDRERFLDYLKKIVVRYQLKIHTYCLMNNHYHLLLETERPNISKVMHDLNSSYTAYFNARYKRAGHLFQGRYKSILVQADKYLHSLSKYIHLNPVRASITKGPEDYLWSSYRYFISDKEVPDFLTTEFILSIFSKDRKKSQVLYEKFVKEAIGKESDVIRENIKGGFILGSSDFVGWVRNKFLKNKKDKEIPQIKQLKVTISPEKIEQIVKQHIDDEKLARKIAVYLIRKYTEKKLSEIGQYCGISDAGASQISYRLERQRENDKKLDLLITEIEKMSNVET